MMWSFCDRSSSLVVRVSYSYAFGLIGERWPFLDEWVDGGWIFGMIACGFEGAVVALAPCTYASAHGAFEGCRFVGKEGSFGCEEERQ